jgi:ATP-binding cassette subfamily F protein 3
MLRLQGVSRHIPGRTLFEAVDWTLQPGERVGLIGPNGSGKSSLLRVMAGADEPDAGRVVLPRGSRVSWIPQEAEAEEPGTRSLISTVLDGAAHLRALAARLDQLERRMSEPPTDEGDGQLDGVRHEYGELRALFEWFGGDCVEARARAVLGGLGFAPEDPDRPLATFSGGWRKRALLARVLLSGAEILLLDEPTNHLDLDALSWLERELARSPAGLVMVSHDRVFLDRVTNRIAWLERGRLRVEKVGYSQWVEARELARRQAEARNRRLATRERQVRRFVERFGAKASKATQASDRKRMLGEIERERASIVVERERTISFRWPTPAAASDPLLLLEAVAKGYDGREVLRDASLTIRPGDRLAVMGRNGAGKTTLLNLVAGVIEPDAGRREVSGGLEIGVFAQHQLEEFDPGARLLDEMERADPDRTPEQLRGVLGIFGLGERWAEREVGTLSGGERARLALARLMLRPCHLLLLDEPTNHLDLSARQALEAGLAGWPGAVMIVSHDRAFLDHLTTEVVDVEAGTLERYPGGWREWQAARLAVEGRPRQIDIDEADRDPRSRAGRRARAEALQRRSRVLRPLRERLESLERQIEQAESDLRGIDAELSDPASHADGARMANLARARDEAEERLERLYDEWPRAAEALEEAEAEGPETER